MKVLVINAGSSSLKFKLFDMDGEIVLANGSAERVGMNSSKFSYYNHVSKKSEKIEKSIENHTMCVKMAVDMLTDEEFGVIDSLEQISAIGHRASHGAEKYSRCVVIDDEVINALINNFDLAPLHNPANLAGVNACREVMPNTPMVILFDTAFHMTIPEEAYMCPVPYEWYEKYHVKNYGFHGISHQYAAQRTIELVGNELSRRIIICHLGNGSSITAVKNGKSVDNSMGFTPLSGIPMGTRCGDMDPTILIYMAKKLGTDCNDVLKMLNTESGLLGLSGISSDLRDIMASWRNGERRAEITLKTLVYKISKYIGSYLPVLGGLDCIVFTGGIGENAAEIREMICSKFEFLGIKLDMEKNYNKNQKLPDERIISEDNMKMKVLIIPANEELCIARETSKLLS